MKHFLIILATLSLVPAVSAQIVLNKEKSSISKSLKLSTATKETIEVDVVKVNRHRERFAASSLISFPIATQIDPVQKGNWVDLSNGGRLCRLQLELSQPGAMAVFFAGVHLPKGAYLALYNEDGRLAKGPFYGSDLSAKNR